MQRKPAKKRQSAHTSEQDDGAVNQGAGFWKCNTIVSFCGAPFYDEKGMHARFAGVFHNHSGDSPEVLDTEKHLPKKLAEIYRKRKGETLYFFCFHKNERFKDLEGRVVVNLNDARNWVKPIEPDNNKGLEVREVLPRGYVRSFPGIENFTLPFAKLKNILENHTANREWHTALSSVAGIYAIRCKDKGKHKLYIGKASGKNGIIGRWQNYADNGHGGNEELKNLSRNRRFSFSVLQASQSLYCLCFATNGIPATDDCAVWAQCANLPVFRAFRGLKNNFCPTAKLQQVGKLTMPANPQ